MKSYIYLILLITVSLFSSFSSAENNLRVTFINPGYASEDHSTGGFWFSVAEFMKAAAEDLDIDLEILYSERNHIKMQRLAEQVIARKYPPDYLLVVNEKLSAESMVIDASMNNIKVFVILNSFEKEQRKHMGNPRGKYKNWIGTLIPDNHYAGYYSAKMLIEHALKSGRLATDGNLHLLGYAGDFMTPASTERVAGMKEAVSEYPNVILKQVVPCYWSKDNAKRKTSSMLLRYPETGAIWAANDPIAVGAIEGVIEAGKIPGKDIFFSGFNWDPQGLIKIENGEMLVSFGGHFMLGGWALVLLYDYHHGQDFIDQGLEIKYRVFEAMQKDNLALFISRSGYRHWGKIDFKKFSKVLNPNIKKYDFSLKALLQQL